MITPFSVKPKAQNKLSLYVAAVCLVLAIVAIAVYTFIPMYKGIVGVIALVFITAAIFIYNKYICASYCYDVTFNSSGEPVLAVRKIVGKRETTMCHVGIEAIINVRKLSREERRSYKSDAGVVRYSYCPTMLPDSVYLVTVRCAYEKADLFLELNDEIAALILQYAREYNSL